MNTGGNFGANWNSRFELQHCKQLFPRFLWDSCRRGRGIKGDGFLQAVEVGGAIRTLCEMALDLTAVSGRQLRVQLFTNMIQNFRAANRLALFHDVI